MASRARRIHPDSALRRMAYREFKDQVSATWCVWDTFPRAGRAPELERGWLTFEHGRARRRLVPAPANWADAPDEDLLRWLLQAKPVAPRGEELPEPPLPEEHKGVADGIRELIERSRRAINRVDQALSTHAKPPVHLPSWRRRMNSVLVVDDYEASRYVHRTLLEHLEFDVLEAASGEEAIELARERLPDFILMDISMPGIGGWAACRELKGDPATASIPVIAFTAHARDYDRRRALEQGFAGFLEKPADARTLMALVRSLAPDE